MFWILFDPMNTDEIANAVKTLYSNSDLCEKLSKGAMKTASTLTIHERAKKILSFIRECLSENLNDRIIKKEEQKYIG